MSVDGEQQPTVIAWLERVADHSVEELLRAFEAAFAALWKRTVLTLGEVTMTAIVDRVLHRVAERYPLVASIETSTSGIRCRCLETRPELRRDEASDAICFLLVEFLTVLGDLTAEILTPALRAELSKVPPAGDRIADPT